MIHKILWKDAKKDTFLCIRSQQIKLVDNLYSSREDRKNPEVNRKPMTLWFRGTAMNCCHIKLLSDLGGGVGYNYYAAGIFPCTSP